MVYLSPLNLKIVQLASAKACLQAYAFLHRALHKAVAPISRVGLDHWDQKIMTMDLGILEIGKILVLIYVGLSLILLVTSFPCLWILFL